MKELKNGIYYTGAINPNLRVFDIIMKTEYGTSYNSYLIKGEKIALVETVHEKFAKIMLDNIEEITPAKNIDYIIMNHTEPDHSGSILTLLEINPDITIVGTSAAIKNIRNIVNRDFNSLVVKTGDKLSLGNGMDAEFIVSPNLHWPDSMFTYIPEQKTVFTCDFLGCHYCEPLLTDDEITYPKAYDESFAYYYLAIFGPFKKFVIDGLDHLEKLDFDMVCTSHGPVLKNGFKKAMELYREWSLPKVKEKNAAIFYVSAYGYTKSAAEAFKQELTKLGIKTEAYNIIEHSYGELVEAFENASGVMFGSPTINRDALKPVWDLISSIDAVTGKGKPFMVFGSYGWSGEACKALHDRAVSFGLKPVSDPYRFLMKPTEDDFNNIRSLAQSFEKAL